MCCGPYEYWILGLCSFHQPCKNRFPGHLLFAQFPAPPVSDQHRAIMLVCRHTRAGWHQGGGSWASRAYKTSSHPQARARQSLSFRALHRASNKELQQQGKQTEISTQIRTSRSGGVVLSQRILLKTNFPALPSEQSSCGPAVRCCYLQSSRWFRIKTGEE